MKLSFISLLLIVSLFNFGCATKRTAGWDQESQNLELSDRESRVIWKSSMKLWKKRHDKKSLEKALEGFEKVAKANPNNYQALAYLCRGKYLLADGHTDDKKMKMKIWEEGISWGEKAMATSPKFKEKMIESEGDVEAGLELLDKKYIDAIYWTAVNLGKWAKESGIATILKYKGRVKHMVNRVGALDKNYFHGAFNRYWGAYYAAAPSFAGGDINKSLKSFNESVDISKNYLGTHVLIAQYYAIKAGDKELFTTKLNYVLKADPKKAMDVMPENIIEQRKAKKLLSQVKELF